MYYEVSYIDGDDGPQFFFFAHPGKAYDFFLECVRAGIIGVRLMTVEGVIPRSGE